MSEWKEVRLGDVIEFNPAETIPKGTMARKVAMEKIQPFKREIDGFEYAEYKGGAKFRNGDTLMARITPCLENGKTAQVRFLNNNEIAFGSTEFIVLREKEAETVNDYIYYLAISPDFRSKAIQSMTGTSGRQRVQVDLLKDIKINIPLTLEQKAIATVLSSLDDKIEINNQINQKLKEIAQAVFKSWFVDFEPFQDGEFEDSELGLIPKGWRVGCFSDHVSILSGGTPKTSIGEYWNGDIPFFTPKDASMGVYCFDTEKTITEKGLDNCNSLLYSKDTVFLTARGTVGKVSIAGREMAMNQSCYALIGKNNISQYFVYFQTLLASSTLQKNANGAVFDAIVVNTFKTIQIVVPDGDVLRRFHNVIKPLFDKIWINIIENNILINIRNIILPKLMNGEIEVGEDL